MRTTLNTIYNNIRGSLDKITTDMEAINQQISSGNQMSKISSNPVNLVSALRFRTTVAEIDQFQDNITKGNTIINASESSLTQMKSLALRAKTLAIQAADPALTPDNLTAIAVEINQMFKQSIELANSQINNQFIFGGQRTSSYTDIEPTPFIIDKGDGHWVNGTALTPLHSELTSTAIATAASLPATPPTALVAGDVLINSEDIGAVDLKTALDIDGVNMAGANDLKTAINQKTTVYASNAATADTTGSTFTFDLNKTPITTTIAIGSTATVVANTTIAAINAQTATTGVTAILGDGTNGGPIDSVVFKNAQAGNNSTITVSNFTTVINGGANPGFGDFSKKIVSATLTTQTAGIAATAIAAGGELIDFSINGTRIAYTLTPATTVAQTAQQTVDIINQASQLTGVTAQLGNGNNGGPASSVVLTNTLAGDESSITLSGLGAGPPDEVALTGLSDGVSSVGAGNNDGRISLSSATSIDITTSGATATTPNDTILNLIGLGGGNKGNFDEAGDGKLVYGYPLSTGELEINGIAVPATAEDNLSTVYNDASATAKATAINSISDQTGVTATIDSAQVIANAAVDAGTELIRPTGKVSNTVIRPGTLAINGTLISSQIDNGASTYGLNMEKANNAKTAINAEFPNTGIQTLLTTLLPNANAAQTGSALAIDFTINNVNVSLITGGISAINTASSVVSAINSLTAQTGVEAVLGDDTNGGIKNSIILSNSIKGNEDAIVVSGLSNLPAPAPGGSESELIGLFNINQAANQTNNSGEISFDSEFAISLSSPGVTPGADIIINELGFSSNNTATLGVGSPITGTVDGTSIAAGLYVNGNLVGPIVGGAPTNLINMDMAASAKAQIETADPNVSVKLTTLTDSGVAATNATQDSVISFKVNGKQVNVSYPSTATAVEISLATANAINQVTADTGVQAAVGSGIPDGTPAGNAPQFAIVFTNNVGDDTAINVTDMAVTSGNNNLGFTNFSQAADATHNTGEITISSSVPFDLSTPLTLNDTILNHLGLGSGATRGYSEKDDGLVYSSDGTGDGTATYGASPKFLSNGDLVINGQNIFTVRTAIVQDDTSNVLIDAINAQTNNTGVKATRGANGVLHLTATDGRNIHVQTSSNGEDITNLTGGSRDQVSFGTLQLSSDRKFTIETLAPSINSNEPGLATIGMTGGSTITGETTDLAGDGKINVFSIHNRTGTVRYAGDREGNLNIKIGKTSTMKVGDNGQTGIADTTLFSTLKDFEDTLRGQNFTAITGILSATDTTAPLNSKNTGLEPASQLSNENLFTDGSFAVVITDHDYDPPSASSLSIGVDTSIDSLSSITERIDGIPHISASWNSDGQLEIKSNDPGRYTISLTNDTSNFLKASGVSLEFMQRQGIDQAMDNLDNLMNRLSEQVSNFGARANRLDIQTQIYTEMTISTKENLSVVQDTDMIKAVLDLKAKETAYQAALSSASKIMQLSLVDFL